MHNLNKLNKMDKRLYLSGFRFFAGVFLCLGGLSITAAGSQSLTGDTCARPNIVLFIVDDLGWQDVSEPFLYENGKPVVTERNRLYRTPNLEKFATHAVKFTQAYAQPVCAPSRVSLMTGQSAALSGVTYLTYPMLNNPRRTSHFEGTLDPPFWRAEGINESDPSLPRQLVRAGYRTIHVGKAHFGAIDRFGGDPENIGFHVNIGGSERGHLSDYSGESGYGKET
jgi:arylsulfatase A-like enzyme